MSEALKAGLQPESVWTDKASVLKLGDHYRVPTELYYQISPTRSGNAPLVVFPRPALAAVDETVLQGRYLLLDQIQDPGNAGALVRAAAAFGFQGVIWHQPCVYPYHHGCIRASAGTIFQLRHYLLQDVAELPSAIHLVGTAANAKQDLESYPWPENLVLAMGNEGHGLSPKLLACLDGVVSIPIQSEVESLNVAGAAHILMYRLRTRF